MRISTIAGAAGVSTRTVRFYHQIGVLPEPRRHANGYRDYTFADLARLLRLRWLADSGLPLATAAGPGHDLLEDVDEALERLRVRRAELDRQEGLLTGLRDNLTAGHRLSPLPTELNQLFESLLGQADASARQVLVTERETLETLALTTGADPELLERYTQVLAAPDVITDVLPLLARFGALAGTDPEAQRPEIQALAAQIAARPAVARLLQYAVADVPVERFTEGDGPGGVPDGPRVTDIVPDPAQRAVLSALVRQVRP